MPSDRVSIVAAMEGDFSYSVHDQKPFTMGIGKYLYGYNENENAVAYWDEYKSFWNSYDIWYDTLLGYDTPEKALLTNYTFEQYINDSYSPKINIVRPLVSSTENGELFIFEKDQPFFWCGFNITYVGNTNSSNGNIGEFYITMPKWKDYPSKASQVYLVTVNYSSSFSGGTVDDDNYLFIKQWSNGREYRGHECFANSTHAALILSFTYWNFRSKFTANCTYHNEHSCYDLAIYEDDDNHLIREANIWPISAYDYVATEYKRKISAGEINYPDNFAFSLQNFYYTNYANWYSQYGIKKVNADKRRPRFDSFYSTDELQSIYSKQKKYISSGHWYSNIFVYLNFNNSQYIAFKPWFEYFKDGSDYDVDEYGLRQVKRIYGKFFEKDDYVNSAANLGNRTTVKLEANIGFFKNGSIDKENSYVAVPNENARLQYSHEDNMCKNTTYLGNIYICEPDCFGFNTYNWVYNNETSEDTFAYPFTQSLSTVSLNNKCKQLSISNIKSRSNRLYFPKLFKTDQLILPKESETSPFFTFCFMSEYGQSEINFTPRC